MYTIDLNCDMGEGTYNDSRLMPLISSCSIACGGHYGSKQTIEETIQLAKAHGVDVGAHPSYPDSENFGRKSMNLPVVELQNALRKQLDLFFSVCTNVHHIKPHGALYNDLFSDLEKAEAVVSVFAEYAKGIWLYCLVGSQLAKVAHRYGFSIGCEAFADRSYTKNGTLVSRSTENAVLTDKHLLAKQVLQMVKSKTVECNSGEIIPINAQTICLHGDGHNVIENATFLVESLIKNNIRVKGL